MTDGWRTFLVSAGIVVAGGWAGWAGSDGFRAFTRESARRLEVERHHPLVPDATLVGADGRATSLREMHGAPLVVDFIYTGCQTVCLTLGASMRSLHRAVLDVPGGDRVRFLSIGFDQLHDTPAALSDYRARFTRDSSRWTVARASTPNDLANLLSGFGVIVLPEADGSFTHNAALHVVDAAGRLVAIRDPSDTLVVMSDLRRLLIPATRAGDGNRR